MKYEDYCKVGKTMLDTIFNSSKDKFLNVFNIKKNNSFLMENNNGNINLYGKKFKKMKKS